jgi:hypothetical protein
MKRSELKTKTVAELKAEARSLGLVGYSKLRRDALVDLLVGSTVPPRKRKPARGGKAPDRTRAAAGKSRKAETKATSKRAKPLARGKRATARGKVRVRKAGATAAEKVLSPRTRRAFSLRRTNGAQQRITAAKYYIGVEETPELDESFVFPQGYGEDFISLMIRDPYWLYAYWELTEERGRELRDILTEDEFATSRLVLRVYDLTGTDMSAPNEHYDIDVSPESRNWYVNVLRVERDYSVDIGVIAPDGSFILVARSSRVSLPPIGPSPVIDEEWVTVDALGHIYRQAEAPPDSESSWWGHGGGKK